MTGQTYFYIHAVTALNADLIVSIHRVIQKGSDFISIESTSDLTEQFTAQWMWPKINRN